MASALAWRPRTAVRLSPVVAPRVVSASRLNLPSSRKLVVLRRRAEFLTVAKNGKKWVTPGLIVQMGPMHQHELPSTRYGLTASTRVGNAVIRNRARRRMRALAAEVLPEASPQHDYVLIAREATATRDYSELKKDLKTALKKLGACK